MVERETEKGSALPFSGGFQNFWDISGPPLEQFCTFIEKICCDLMSSRVIVRGLSSHIGQQLCGFTVKRIVNVLRFQQKVYALRMIF